MYLFVITHSFKKLMIGQSYDSFNIFFDRKDTYGDTHELINRKKNILPYYSEIGNCVLLKGILGSQETLW